MKEFVFDRIRVELVSSRIIRIEKKREDKFEDRNTFFVPNREFFKDEIQYTSKKRKQYTEIILSGYQIRIDNKAKGLQHISIYKGKKEVYHYVPLKNSGELPEFADTPFVFPLIDNPRIIVPEHGYHFTGSESKTDDFEIDESAEDLYLLLTDKDPFLLRKLYLDLTGRIDLLRLSAFGSWNSKYYPYTQEEAKQIIKDYQSHDIPLDNLVIDTDWRKTANGMGYDINTDLFPDMKSYFEFAHENHIEIMFNDHPEPQKEARNLLDPSEIKYREENLQRLMSMGLDYWWYDRNWITKLIAPDSFIHPETWGMYLFNDIEKHYYQNQSSSYQRRTGLMSNTDNIENGIYRGIQNSASHRYPFQWTGDILSTSLCENIDNILKAGKNCIPYVHPDCGGHIGNPNKELFIRWMQMGCFFPALRPHCTNNVKRTREPWVYDEETTDIVRDYIKMRYRLLPMIYRDAYQSYIDGTPLCRSLDYVDFNDKNNSKYPFEYLFGDFLVAYPHHQAMLGKNQQEIEQSCYLSKVKAVFYKGTELKGEPLLEKEYEKVSFELNGNPLEEGLPVNEFSARFEFSLCLEKDGYLMAISDDGIKIYVDDKLEGEDWSSHAPSPCLTGMLSKGNHKITIEYFQDSGGAKLALYFIKPFKVRENEIYFPKGEWVDVFTGKTYKGHTTTVKECSLNEMPLYVKKGSLVPLAKDNNNTKEQHWDELTLDYYPSKKETYSSFLYEDDRETVAYQDGKNSIIPYSASFDKEKNSFIVRLGKAIGEFEGEYYSPKKHMKLKLHMLYQDEVEKVLCNDIEVPFSSFARNMKSKVILNENTSIDSETTIVEFDYDSKEEAHIEICLLKK